MGSPPVTVNLGAGAFNELGVAPGGHANLNGTTMQLAVLEAIGSGAVLTATNSDIWSQTIQADMQATLNLVGSVVHGGALVATGGGTLQLDNGTELWADGVTTAPNCVFNDDYSWMLAHMGRPLCNPYSNPTMMSSRIHDSGSSINANQTHPACPWSAAGYAPAIDFEMGPAVTSATPGSVSCVPNAGTTVTGSVSAYPYLLSGVQPSTAYACTITAAGSPQSYAVTTSACQY